jgi:hypothetical protein
MSDLQLQEMLCELELQYAELLADGAPARELSGLWAQIRYFRELEAAA